MPWMLYKRNGATLVSFSCLPVPVMNLSEQRLLDAFPEVYCIVDRNFRLVKVNHTCLELLDMQREEVEGRLVNEVIGEETVNKKLRPWLERCLAGEPVQFRERFEFGEGGVSYLEIHYYPMRGADGRVEGIAVKARDWSELGHAEEETMALRQQLGILKRINRLIGREKESKRLLERACGILGGDESYRMVSLQSIGPEGQLEHVASCGLAREQAEAFEAYIRKSYPVPCVRQAGHTHRLVEVVHEGSECEDCPMGKMGLPGASYVTQLKHQGERYGYLMVVMSGQPPLKRAEKYLEEVAGDLGFALHALRMERERSEVMASMERARAEAEKANRTKSRFLSTMSHEIRNPLNGIMGIADYLGEKDWDADTAECLNVLRKSSEILGGLIQEILDYSKIEAGRMEICPAPTRIQLQTEELMSLFRQRARERGLAFEAEVALEEGVVAVDWPRVRQVLMNLVSNALKFTPRGGQVTLTAQSAGEELEFAVSDTGVGIAPEDQKELFEPFVQVAKDSGHNGQGTGLGLAICKSLVERMGGTIGVESSAGDGSRFWFRIPVKK